MAEEMTCTMYLCGGGGSGGADWRCMWGADWGWECGGYVPLEMTCTMYLGARGGTRRLVMVTVNVVLCVGDDLHHVPGGVGWGSELEVHDGGILGVGRRI